MWACHARLPVCKLHSCPLHLCSVDGYIPREQLNKLTEFFEERFVLQCRRLDNHCTFTTNTYASLFFLNHVLLTETTHQKVRYNKLEGKDKKDCDAARQKEFDKLTQYKTYKAVPRHTVPKNAHIVDALTVDTLKMLPDGSRTYI